MTTQNFSNTFDTLLASYNILALFGEGASKAEITLDEYEKSVFLTQAQDIILKSYFDRTLNNQGQGFDDSTRRLVDFSSLIKIAELNPIYAKTYDVIVHSASSPSNSLNYGTLSLETEKEYTFNFTVGYESEDENFVYIQITGNYINIYSYFKNTNSETVEDLLNEIYKEWKKLPASTTDGITLTVNSSGQKRLIDFAEETISDSKIPYKASSLFDDRGILFTLPKNDKGYTDVLFILNEKLSVVKDGASKDYVIVPISYKEYDREMSKPYAQPLKKQAWRLFQNTNTGFDVDSELIPIWDVADAIKSRTADAIYKIRYVKRPKPIVLTNLDGLDIDGETNASEECELNPILHMDILNKAVELAIVSKVGRAARNTDKEELESRRNR